MPNSKSCRLNPGRLKPSRLNPSRRKLSVEDLESRFLLAVDLVELPGLHFSTPQVAEISPANNPSVTDFNGDGLRDLVEPHEDGLAISLALDAQDFEAPFVIPSENILSSWVVGDISNDERMDIVVIGSLAGSHFLLVYLADDSGRSFTLASTTSIDNRFESMELGDTNQDGHVDLVAAGFYSAVVFHGNGIGNFAEPIAFGDSRLSSRHVSLADLDQDGDPDILLREGPSLAVFRNDNGVFETEVARFELEWGGETPTSFVFDVNKDGILDLLLPAGSSEGSHIELYWGVGDSTFTVFPIEIAIVGVAVDVAVADINGDQLSDLVVAHSSTIHHPQNSNGPPGTSVVLANDTGSFHSAIRISTISGIAVTVEDANGDGLNDISLLNNDRVYTFEQVPSIGEVFATPATLFQSSDRLVGMGAGDLNGDSLADFVIAKNREVEIVLVASDGTRTSKTFETTFDVKYVEVANLDGDSDAEFAVVGPTSTTVFGLGDNGEIEEHSTDLPAIRNFLDVDDDGIVDLLAREESGTALYRGSIDGSFERQLISSHAMSSVFKESFNNDELPDLLIETGDGFAVLLANADRTFTTSHHGLAVGKIHLAYVTLDTQPDIVYKSQMDLQTI